MHIGVVFPQVEIGADPGAIRDYAQAVEAMGYTHILTFDHVLGANPDRPGGWKGPYTYRHAFHEPFVLFGFLAAATRRVELVTGILILPQRQTALVAKQAAAVDVLSAGRLRLGVGVGWNAVEFEALGERFTNRGARIEEQIAVLRALWARDLVTIEGQWHRVTDAGLNPVAAAAHDPDLDGRRERARRAPRGAPGGRVDAPLPPGTPGAGHRGPAARPDPGGRPRPGGLRHRGAHDAGAGAARRACEAELAAWREMRGITHLSVHTVGLGLKTPAEHVQALERFKKDLLT